MKGAAYLVMSMMFSPCFGYAQDLSTCISISTTQASSDGMTFASTFTNNCGKCVSFAPVAVGINGSSDLPMGSFVSLGQPIYSAQLQSGGADTYFWGGQFGSWRATAINPQVCN